MTFAVVVDDQPGGDCLHECMVGMDGLRFEDPNKLWGCLACGLISTVEFVDLPDLALVFP